MWSGGGGRRKGGVWGWCREEMCGVVCGLWRPCGGGPQDVRHAHLAFLFLK